MAKVRHYHAHVIPKFIADHRIRTFAEVGVYHGTFTKNVLRHVGGYLDQYWGIDRWSVLPEEEPQRMSHITQEEWDDMYRSVCKIMTYFPSLRIIRQPSLAAAELFPDGYFDMVYIDASHFYERVLDDIYAWLPKVRPGGILGGHDYVNKGKKLEAKRAVDEVFPEGVNTLPDTVWWVKL